jgi:hypothetical protein
VVLSKQMIIHFPMEDRIDNHHLGVGFFVHKGIRSTVERKTLISDKMS